MKYAVFWAAFAAVPAFALVLSLNRRWIRWGFFGMVAGLCIDNASFNGSINFLSQEMYRGSSRGIEVNIIHLMSLSVLIALALRGKWQRLLPEGGVRLFALYFLLCLPSLANADNLLVGWFELWKMLMLFLFWHAVYGYLAATDDTGSVVKALAAFVLANFAEVAMQHYGGVHQAPGLFPHQNPMAMAMNLLGPLFFAGYLQMGLRSRFGWLCAAAFAGAALSAMWSYSRGAIVVLPVGYGLAALGCLSAVRMSPGRVLARLSPMFLAGLAGLVAMWPHLQERFSTSKDNNASKNTRIALATCAAEMMKAHPWAGVGINNWSLNLEEPHSYVERAEDKLGKEWKDRGIVETVYLLTGAECGIPALLAMLAWFAWHAAACLRMVRRLRGTRWHFVAAGLLGGFAANYLQSILEWVLRQRMNMFLLVFCFALVAHLRKSRRPAKEAA